MALPTLSDFEKIPHLGPWPRSAINCNMGGSRAPHDPSLVDGSSGRVQPAIWQWLPSTYMPDRFVAAERDAAIRGDLAMLRDAHSLCMFNGVSWENVSGMLGNRIGALDRFFRKPTLTGVRTGRFTLTGDSGVTTGISIGSVPAACILRSISCRITTSVASVTYQPVKAASLTAISGGTALTAATVDGATTVNTLVSPALHGTPANIALAAGDTIGIVIASGGSSCAATWTFELEFTTVEADAQPNENWTLGGTNMTDTLCTRLATGGYKLTTAGADNDKALLSPRASTLLDTLTFLPTQLPIFEALVKVGSGTPRTNWLTKTAIWAGLKLTNVYTPETDDDSVYFKFDGELAGTLTKWGACFSIAGTDYVINTDIVVTENSIFHLKIMIALDARGKYEPYFFIDGVLVAKGSDHASWTAGTTELTKTAALKPYVGMQALEAVVREMTVFGINAHKQVA